MKHSFKKAAVALAATAGLTAGGFAAAAPAQAATPGDLALIGGVNCEFKRWGPNWNSGPIWQMKRWMGVKNIGGSPMTNVWVHEIAGASKRVAIKGQPGGVLRPNQTYIAVSTTWPGCWPSSISGYTIGDQVENIFNNAGFWANVRSIDPPNRAPAPQQEGGNQQDGTGNDA